MKGIMKRIISLILVLSLIMSASVVVFADEPEEEYLSDLKIVYADTYKEAREKLDKSGFKDYKLLDSDLNTTAAKINLGVSLFDSQGVWLAYKTTTDVDNAITDIAIMQMNGGYQEGNYQEMIAESFQEYIRIGETYLEAIEYFISAYEAEDVLANAAFRQLNLYCDNDYFGGERIGNVFLNGIGAGELATMFMEGNIYAMNNIKALLAMGVSYNENGKTYLELVGEAAAEMEEDPEVFDNEEYDELAATVALSLINLRYVFEELEAVREELDYEDDDVTPLEIEYAESMALAVLTEEVTYLDGNTLYDFCLSYEYNDEDYSSLYPLIAGMNSGQRAISEAGQFINIIRYSVSNYPADIMEEELSMVEGRYIDNPFDIYLGVDRSIYEGTYALTNDAYRADTMTDKGLWETLYSKERGLYIALEITFGTIGVGLSVWAIVRAKNASAAQKALDAAVETKINLMGGMRDLANQTLTTSTGATAHASDFVDALLTRYVPDHGYVWGDFPYIEKLACLKEHFTTNGYGDLPVNAQKTFDRLHKEAVRVYENYYPSDSAANPFEMPVVPGVGTKFLTAGLFALGAAMMFYSAFSYGSAIVSYYNPDYEDIPIAMIDMIETVDGDRYIKYDAATMIEANDNTGLYDAADLNAFEGQRWNALYFTKSYEAGKPLLAEFNVSHDNNVASPNHLAVHRFGEIVCYDLNKHNFSYEKNIYLSVKQSDKQKSAVAEVPDLVGSLFSYGFFFLAGGLGLLTGMGITLGVQSIQKKKSKTDKEIEEV